MSLKSFIQSRVSAKQFCRWGEAAQAAGVGKFMPSRIDAITKAFRECMPGSDAIIVNERGEYGRAELVERHAEFLSANGYDRVPGFTAKVPKEKRSVDPVAVAPASTELAELRAKVELLTSLLVNR